MLALGARCRRFESFRPDQKIQTVAFNFLGGPCGFKRQTAVCRGFESFTRSRCDLRVFSYLCELRRACSYILGFPRLMPVGILVVIRTALTLVLIYSDSLGLSRSYSNGADACSHILGFAAIKICRLRRKRGVLYSKMHGM